MSQRYPCTIVSDRYSGTYSGGQWLAWPLDYDNVPGGSDAGDCECGDFWRHYKRPVGKGNTPQEALDDLNKIMSGEKDN